jgi:hypothetical protein
MKPRSQFGIFKAKKDKTSGLDLPFNPEAVLCHDAFKKQKIHYLVGSDPTSIYKSIDKLKPDDIVCAVCITDDPRGGKEYNFSGLCK